MNIEVLVADDHPVIRRGLKTILADTRDLVVAGEAHDALSVMELVRRRDWSLLVLDLSMPGRAGLGLIKQVKAERPRLPVLVFSMHIEDQYAVRAIRAGASGYLCKCADAAVVLQAIRSCAAGDVFISEKVAALLAGDAERAGETSPHMLLTDREYGIFQRIVSGAKLTDIAGELSLSIKTVSTHKTNILEKMTLTGPVELVRYAIEHKLL